MPDAPPTPVIKRKLNDGVEHNSAVTPRESLWPSQARTAGNPGRTFRRLGGCASAASCDSSEFPEFSSHTQAQTGNSNFREMMPQNSRTNPEGLEDPTRPMAETLAESKKSKYNASLSDEFPHNRMRLRRTEVCSTTDEMLQSAARLATVRHSARPTGRTAWRRRVRSYAWL